MLFGEALVTALEGSLGSVTADIKGSPDGNLQVQIRDLLNQSRAEAPSGAMRFDVELVASTGETGRALPYFVTDTAFKPRSPIDWLMHREVVFDVPLAAAAISGRPVCVSEAECAEECLTCGEGGEVREARLACEAAEEKCEGAGETCTAAEGAPAVNLAEGGVINVENTGTLSLTDGTLSFCTLDNLCTDLS